MSEKLSEGAKAWLNSVDHVTDSVDRNGNPVAMTTVKTGRSNSHFHDGRTEAIRGWFENHLRENGMTGADASWARD